MTETIRTVQYGAGRTALLDATVRVVARSGLRKLTNRAVAEEAGVTHGLVGHHFGSRDALIEAALRHVVDKNIGDPVLEAEITSVDEFAVGLIDLVDSDPDSQAFLYELILEGRRRPELRRSIDEQYADFREATRRQLNRLGLGDAPGLDIAIFALLDGLVFQYVTENRPGVIEHALAAMRQLLRTAAAPD